MASSLLTTGVTIDKGIFLNQRYTTPIVANHQYNIAGVESRKSGQVSHVVGLIMPLRNDSWWVQDRSGRCRSNPTLCSLRQQSAVLHLIPIQPSVFPLASLHQGQFSTHTKKSKTDHQHRKGKEAASCYSITKCLRSSLWYVCPRPS